MQPRQNSGGGGSAGGNCGADVLPLAQRVRHDDLKELEKENGRLKKLVADLGLDNAILRDVNSKNF